MSVSERQRHQLYTRAVEVLGHEEAEILMAHLPLGGTATVATKQDLKSELRAVEERLRTEIHRVARTQLLMFVSIVALLNGGLFAALRFS